MTFVHGYFLLLLLIPLYFLLRSFSPNKKNIKNIFSKEMYRLLYHNNALLSENRQYKLFLLSLAFLIIAGARPVLQEKTLLNEEKSPSIVIALDVSLSMQKKDLYPSREIYAQEKLREILKEVQNSSVSLLLFAKESYLLYPLSKDKNSLLYLLQQGIDTKNFAHSSNLFGVFEASAKILKYSKEKNILLLSDGAEEVNREKELVFLQTQGIKLFSLCTQQKQNHALKHLSSKTHGAYVQGTWGNSDVKSLLQSIKNSTKKMETEAYKHLHYKELFAFPLTLTLLLFILLLFGKKTKAMQKSRRAIFVVVLFFSYAPIHAGVFDFFHLYNAQKYYESQEYVNAIKEYKQVTSNKKIAYNLANAYYKNAAYKNAIMSYKKALTITNKEFDAKIYHNLSNTFVHLDKLDIALQYCKLSLKTYSYKQTVKNCKLIAKELKKRKKLYTKTFHKLHFKNIVSQETFRMSSRYAVKLEKYTLSDEEKWMRHIQHNNNLLFLQKIKTHRRSLDANKPY